VKQTFSPPQTMELAMLAAILRPSAKNPADALKVAAEWYFEAVLFVDSDSPKVIQSLIEKKRRERRQKLAVETIKELQAAKWSDKVDMVKARELLANPRKLAEALDKLPKEGEPPPEPGTRIETPLHELPGIPVRKLKADWALRKNVLQGWLEAEQRTVCACVTFHPHAQRNAFCRRDARQQSRSFAPEHQ
jgi:hypothetical protein